MKIREIISESYLLEFLNPKKPESIKSSTVSKAGTQGSVIKLAQRRFMTAKNNDVKVQFQGKLADNGEKSVDVVFYVNDTLYDNSSTVDKNIKNDYEILSGVVYVILQYLDKSKINHFTFQAYRGEGDNKRLYNLPIKNLTAVNDAIGILYNKIRSFNITDDMIAAELTRRNELLKKINKPPVNQVVIIYKKELLEVLHKLKQLLIDLQPSSESIQEFTNLYQLLERYNVRVEGWEEYQNLIPLLNEVRQILMSYGSQGVMVNRNRRLSVYSKLLKTNFSKEWDIQQYGDNFELSRKRPTLNEEVSDIELHNILSAIRRAWAAQKIAIVLDDHFITRLNDIRNNVAIYGINNVGVTPALLQNTLVRAATIHGPGIYANMYVKKKTGNKEPNVDAVVSEKEKEKDNSEGVIKETTHKINIPFVVIDVSNNIMTILLKTIMIKDTFGSSNKVFRVRPDKHPNLPGTV
jgi:hypothetical protein